MTIQYRRHTCKEKPRNIEVVQMVIDRTGLSWELVAKETERAARIEARVYIEYCPWCGEKL